MDKKENKVHFFDNTIFRIVGALAVLLLAVVLLWHGNTTSNQAPDAIVAQVYFDGEYRIADGPWNRIIEGEHIPSTKGDVTLRGNFHMMTPNGEYVGIYSGDIPIAFHANHINVAVYEGEGEPYVIDTENPLYGASACGDTWTAYLLTPGNEDPIEIRIHNPHRFGNENSIDEMLSGIALWTGSDFEMGVLESGGSQRDIGLLFVIVSLMFYGTAFFSTLTHIKNSKIIWALGTVILFAGAYLCYSADGVYFWRESIVSNTIILGCSMMFYMLFLSMVVVHLFKKTKTFGTITVITLGAFNSLLFILPILTGIVFYDTWIYWAIVQLIANILILVCLIKEFCAESGKGRWLYIGLLFPFIAFSLDVLMTAVGLWRGGIASKCVFIVFFIVSIISVLQIITHSINAITKAKELETERILLNAQLTESRVSTMMSQIRPHFIYNTLGSIEQLCSIDPQKAGDLVHNFAKYLRGNFGELDNPKPILMSQEMEHVHYYVSIENVRFPDMTVSFEMNAGDFHIPALTIQPIVENAIKHGLMKLPKGGSIRIVSYETDTHYCVSVEDDGVGFDTDVLLDERKHVGIRNIRGRLKAMVNGELEIESTVGVGTKVRINIPKEVRK